MQLDVNGRPHDVSDAPGRLLLWALRDELGLIGTRYGCGIGLCGSCTVHVDGEAVRSCLCRCGTYVRIRLAVLEAQRRIQAGGGA